MGDDSLGVTQGLTRGAGHESTADVVRVGDDLALPDVPQMDNCESAGVFTAIDLAM